MSRLQNVCRIGQLSVSEKLEANLISWLDWGFVNAGGYINVEIDQTGCYVGNQSLLEEVTDLRDSGIYWQGPTNFVYESGTESSPAPFYEPLVYVNSILDSGAVVNYRDGQIVPTSGVTGNTIKCSFSYKWTTFTSARKSPSVRRLKYGHTRTDIDNGQVGLPTQTTLPLPAVIIDVPPISSSRPYTLTRLGMKTYKHNINISVIGESASDVTKICDYICGQEGVAILGFDPDLVIASGDFPLNFDGTKNSGKSHKELAAQYGWSTIHIVSAEGLWGSYINENLYEANVRLVTELVACLGC